MGSESPFYAFVAKLLSSTIFTLKTFASQITVKTPLTTEKRSLILSPVSLVLAATDSEFLTTAAAYVSKHKVNFSAVRVGGRLSTAVAFALPTQPSRV